MYSGQLCLSNRWSLFFILESYVRSFSRYCFIRNYASIPVQLEVVVLQYISLCVPIVWTLVFNQYSCFCQFLVDNVCYSVMSFSYSVDASCSHAAVMCCIVSDSFPHLLHNSSVSGCFKIYFLQFLLNKTWSCIAVGKSSVSANKSALVSHLFDASMSTCCWLRSCGCRPYKALWNHCLLTLLLYSSSVASSFSFGRSKSSGVYLIIIIIITYSN